MKVKSLMLIIYFLIIFNNNKKDSFKILNKKMNILNK